MLKLKFIICTILLLCSVFLFAQVPPQVEAQAQAKLQKSGADEDEVRRKLMERGIDIDNINPNNPQEVLKLQQALEEIEKEQLAELKEAKKEAVEAVSDKLEVVAEKEVRQEVKEVASSTAEEITEAVEEGATVQEALTEGIIDAQEEELPSAAIYGQHIFRNKEIKTYRNANDMVAPNSYILGAGDKIAISLWGYSELDATYEVNKDGYIKPDGMSRINLKGITLGKAKGLLQSRFSSFYRFGKDQFEVTVTYPRTITVNIVGEVMNSGSFTMPAINTAFNALAAAGGPSNIGSVRNIKLIRPGGENREMDVYEFLLDPSITKDYYLQDNDIIFVGVAERLISIQGAIRRPFKYELKPTEQLKDLVKYSAGLRPNAYQSNFQVKRFVDDSEKIFDVNYRELLNNGGDFTLKGGDRVVIGVIPTPYKNYVEIIGSVDIPGKYELEGGMKISDLVEKGILAEGSRTDVAYLRRKADDGTVKYNRINIENAITNKQGLENLILQPKDQLVVMSKSKFLDQYEIAISGAVRKPSTYKYNSGNDLKVSDLVTLAGGLKEDATSFAYVYRKELTGSTEKEYLKIDIKNALENPDSGDNLILRPNDKVQVFSVYTYTDEFEVSITGAVRNPSSYAYDASKKLKVDDLVTLSGGLKPDATDFAYIYRIDPSNDREKEYIRIDIKNALENPTSPDNIVLQPKDRIEILSKLTYVDEFSVRVSGAVRNPGAYQYHSSLTLKDVLTLSGGLKLIASTNRIDVFRTVLNQNEPTKSIVATVEVDENLEMVSQNDFKLEPFDVIYVRSIPGFKLQQYVNINGEVTYPGGYALLDNNEQLTSLIQRSGGLTPEAFPEGATLYREQGGTGYVILRLDEAMKNKNNRHNFILKEGDIITIPKQKDLVTISGATRARDLYPDNIGVGKINVAFKSGKRAKWYVEEYAAGVGENGKNKLITVEHSNGEIKRTKNFLLFKVYPKVKEGSVVKVGVKPPKPPEEEREKRAKIDWGKVLADSVAQATAVFVFNLVIRTNIMEEQNHIEEDEITLKELILKMQEFFGEVVKNWVFVVLITLPFVVYFLYKTYKTPITYPAKLTFMINEDGNSSNAALGGLASSFLGVGAGGEYKLEKMLALLMSRNIIQQALFERTEYNGKDDTYANHMIDEYEYHEIWEKGDVEAIKGFKFQYKDIKTFSRLENGVLKQLYRKIVGTEEKVGILTSSINEDTGIMSISLNALNEEFSVLFIRVIFSKLEQFYVDKTIEKQKNNFEIVNEKVDSIRQALDVTQYRLLKFQDTKRNISLNQNKVERLELERELRALGRAYGKALENLEVASFTLKVKTPFVQVIDDPIPPLPPSKNIITYIKNIIIGGLLGGFLSIGFIIVRKIYRDLMS